MRQWYFENIPDFRAEVGFETRFEIRNEGRVFLHQWKVTEVVSLRKIEYDWTYAGYSGEFLSTFELSEQQDQTTLTLTALVLESFPVPHTNVCTIQPQQVGRAVGRGCGCARAS